MKANWSLAMKSEQKYNNSIFIQDNTNTFWKMTDIVCRRPELIEFSWNLQIAPETSFLHGVILIHVSLWKFICNNESYYMVV